MFWDAAERRFDLVLFWALNSFWREGVLETLQYLKRDSRPGEAHWPGKFETRPPPRQIAESSTIQ